MYTCMTPVGFDTSDKFENHWLKDKHRTLHAGATIDAKRLCSSNAVLFSVRVLAQKNYISKKGMTYLQAF